MVCTTVHTRDGACRASAGCPHGGAGPDKSNALLEAMRRLEILGHQRIVMMTREDRRRPVPGRFEQVFLAALEARGITPGSFHLPNWENRREAFHERLELLFAHTPPTAIFLDDIQLFIAAQSHLAQRGIKTPDDVSLICTDPDPAFDMCRPTVAHIAWENAPVVRRIVRWANNTSVGQEDRRQTFSKASFVEGEAVGPAP